VVGLFQQQQAFNGLKAKYLLLWKARSKIILMFKIPSSWKACAVN